MLRSIMTFIMVALLPFRAIGAQEMKTTKYPFMGYSLGNDEARLALQGIARAAGNSCIINVTGFADGNPYKTNNKEQNQDLADRRASKVATILNEIEKIELGRIHSKGITVSQRGPQYRGVEISLDCPVASAPVSKNDSLATVAKELDTLQTAIKAVKQEVKNLDSLVMEIDEEVHETTAKVDSIIAADTGKKEVQKNESWIDFGIGLAYGMSGGSNRLSMLTVGGGLFVKPRRTPFELTGRYGYLPRGNTKKCSQANHSFDLGVRRDIGKGFGVTAGGGSDEVRCTSGKENTNGNWLQKYDFVRIGGDKGVQLSSDTRGIWNFDLTYGKNNVAKSVEKPTKGIGWRFGAMIRWTPRGNP